MSYHSNVGTFFFSIALLMTMYMIANAAIRIIAAIHRVFCFCVSFFMRVSISSLSSYSFLFLFSSNRSRSSYYLCLIFSSSFYFLRTTRSSCRLFYIYISLILFFSELSLMNSMVCPFLFFRLLSKPSLCPKVSSLWVIVWWPLMQASCKAVLPSLFCELKKNCF